MTLRKHRIAVLQRYKMEGKGNKVYFLLGDIRNITTPNCPKISLTFIKHFEGRCTGTSFETVRLNVTDYSFNPETGIYFAALLKLLMTLATKSDSEKSRRSDCNIINLIRKPHFLDQKTAF
jgi:hypothetical protein